MPLAEAVVMAAGVGSRMRPVTDVYAKPVLPVDGRPVLATLLRELAGAGVERAYVVVGHYAAQVEALAGDGPGWGLAITYVPQPEPLGSADAVARALEAGARPPVLVTAADNVYAPGDIARFVSVWGASRTEGAVAWRRVTPHVEEKNRIAVQEGLVVRVPAPDRSGPYVAAPLWVLGAEAAARLRADRPPWELAAAFQGAIDAGSKIAAVEIGETRDLTSPVDLVRENFPYLEGLERRG